MNMTHPNILEAERIGMPSPKQQEPEAKRIQCHHCTGYFDEDDIEHKPMCYECKEKLDSYMVILKQRNWFLSAIEAIRTTADLKAIHGLCDGILANYKEE